jgi:uncharacterized protein (TIGR02231 family)
MKNLVLMSMIICLSIRLYAVEDTLKVKSQIDRVTVFLRGGEEMRKANVQLPKGTTRVMFDKLSPNIDINSIQLKSKQEITILSVVHQFNYMEQLVKTEKIKSLENDKDELQKKMETDQSMMMVYKQEEELILSNKKLSSEQMGVNIDELKKAADFYRTKLTEIKTNQLEINRRIAKYNNDIAKINSQLAELNVKQTSKPGEIIVTIATKEQINVELTLSYFIDNCGWVPKYNLRAKNVESPLELNYKAEVYQNTGCDWNNIDLVLSTGEPLKSGTKPQLEKWVINNYNSGSGANQSQSKNFTNTSFQLKTKYSIPSNGKNYSADLIDYSSKNRRSGFSDGQNCKLGTIQPAKRRSKPVFRRHFCGQILAGCNQT